MESLEHAFIVMYHFYTGSMLQLIQIYKHVRLRGRQGWTAHVLSYVVNICFIFVNCWSSNFHYYFLPVRELEIWRENTHMYFERDMMCITEILIYNSCSTTHILTSPLYTIEYYVKLLRRFSFGHGHILVSQYCENRNL